VGLSITTSGAKADMVFLTLLPSAPSCALLTLSEVPYKFYHKFGVNQIVTRSFTMKDGLLTESVLVSIDASSIFVLCKPDGKAF
jgi:hypothetical protein